MKYCNKCGNPMEDEMLFCQKCGARVAESSATNTSINEHETAQPTKIDVIQNQSGKPRKGMKILAIVCGVFAVLYAIIGIAAGEPAMAAGLAGFFVVFAVMFYVLAKSPKANPFILDKQSGLKKKTFVFLCVIISFVICGVCAGISGGSASNNPAGGSAGLTSAQEGNNPGDTENNLCDVEQFANITGEELIALLGEPDSISDGTCNGAFEIPCVYYNYNNNEILGEVSFVLVNNEVVRFTSYKDDYEYSGKGSVLEDFGIEEGENSTVVADAGAALRYRCPSDVVDDFWINLIEDDTFGFLQVTYEMMYYEEWYLPMNISEKSNYNYWTEEAVKSLLKAPNTADFPNITEWNIVANSFYVGVQSYVDAQNSFGAEIRSEFTFIYIADTSEIIYAVFDGEVIADNGYTPTADLVAQIAAGNTQE